MGRKRSTQLEDLPWPAYLTQTFEQDDLVIVEERMKILGGTLGL